MLPIVITYAPFTSMYRKVSGKKVRQQAPWAMKKSFQIRADVKQDINVLLKSLYGSTKCRAK